jgi:hypothetical protein
MSFDEACDVIVQSVFTTLEGAITKTEAWGEGQFILPRMLPAL